MSDLELTELGANAPRAKVLKKWRGFLFSTATYMPVFAPWLLQGIWIRFDPNHPELDLKWPPDPETTTGSRRT
jgi:hypothetical protein